MRRRGPGALASTKMANLQATRVTRRRHESPHRSPGPPSAAADDDNLHVVNDQCIGRTGAPAPRLTHMHANLVPVMQAHR
jgi:hypothetical protein